MPGAQVLTTGRYEFTKLVEESTFAKCQAGEFCKHPN